MNNPNPFQPPKANLDTGPRGDIANTSGQGKDAVIPEGIKGWSWGAFFWTWIWAIGNKTYIGLLALIPYVGFIMAIYLGIKGREMAWRNKQWDSVEHFQRVQRKWTMWALIFFGIAFVGILAAIVLPATQR
jgi:hypothetical protein